MALARVAFVAEKWGRRWITCDTSRVALALARARITNATFPNYKLVERDNPAAGFDYKTVPRITLKDIAYNEEIDKIWEEFEAELQPLRVKLGFAEDWQVPREQSSPDLATYNQSRHKRQEKIDASISASATQEILYDKPHEEKGTVRVAGPFTVESFSAFRFPNMELSKSEKIAAEDESRYIVAVREKLKKAGIENSRKAERIEFSRVEAFPDPVISAIGHYKDQQGREKKAAIAFGPRYASIGEAFLKKAAKKAVEGHGHDLLVVCGFAFEADFLEKKQQYGKLNILPAKMHLDLADPENPLRSQKGHSDNLFMVFGEPDIKQSTDNDGNVIVEIVGVDVFNPMTNEVTSCSPDEIACWFIDTNYTGDCFFVRQAYFTGGQDPYKQLKKALKNEINVEAWEALRGNVSCPFVKPETGKIAVKVINHYGDEVTKTFSIA